MSIALDNSVVVNIGTGTATTSFTTSGTNPIMFVGLEIGILDAITAISYNGVAMTLINSVSDTPNGVQTLLYYVLGYTVGTNNISITMTGAQGANGCAVSYNGAKQTGQPDASQTGGPTSTSSFSISKSSVANNCWAVMIAGSNGGTFTAGAGTTLRKAVNGACGMYDNNGPITPAGSVTLTATIGGGATSTSGVLATFAPAPTNSGNFLMFF